MGKARSSTIAPIKMFEMNNIYLILRSHLWTELGLTMVWDFQNVTFIFNYHLSGGQFWNGEKAINPDTCKELPTIKLIPSSQVSQTYFLN
ncbi:hypothetical protein CK510_29695 [Brunnivagina elsteri CCALA 953]|uniref:Uncharacterized protein n=1 Tax=Brunnivagina elsteri CCALA 953 TaxID=987040 RepID=A0A2A2TA21_9CYAN|nr:hypothetical protein CK510_29695 [Calothrix elsteri CCALA 953]